MNTFYVWDTETKLYSGRLICKVGKNPENSTEIEPLPFKENNEIKWNGKKWVYQPMK